MSQILIYSYNLMQLSHNPAGFIINFPEDSHIYDFILFAGDHLSIVALFVEKFLKFLTN